MSKERLINTKFWNDGWVRKINPLDRYLFIYFLTNEYTNISGVYELPLSTISYGTGIDERDLEKSMLPRLEPKVYYKDGWVILINFPKHQRLNSNSVVEGIKRALIEAPKSVIEFAISKGYGDGLDIIPPSYHILNQTKLNQTKPIASANADANILISEIIKLFENINPNCKTMYGNTTQRKACKFLLDTYGFESVKERITFLPKTNTIQFFPTITTPKQLQDKWASLENSLVKRGNEIKSKQKVVW